MNFLISTFLIAITSFIAEQFFPWWSVVLCAFIVGAFIEERGIGALLSGFLGVGLLWLVMAYQIDASNHSLLTSKLATIFGFKQPMSLIALTGLVGGVGGALGALSGNHLRKIKPRNRDAYYKRK